MQNHTKNSFAKLEGSNKFDFGAVIYLLLAYLTRYDYL